MAERTEVLQRYECFECGEEFALPVIVARLLEPVCPSCNGVEEVYLMN